MTETIRTVSGSLNDNIINNIGIINNMQLSDKTSMIAVKLYYLTLWPFFPVNPISPASPTGP